MRSKWLIIISFAVLACMYGCRSSKPIGEDVLARLLGEGSNNGNEDYVGPDAPEQPVSGLPAPSPESRSSAKKGSITIQPDCLLQIKVKEDSSLEGSYPVNEIGAVELGYVGPVILYNMTEKDAEAKIAEVLEGRYFKKATVNVRISRASYDKVQVTGAVNTPGLIKIGPGDAISLNDALRRSGGLKVAIKSAKVRIVRDGLLTPLAPALEGEEYVLVTDAGEPSVPDINLDNNDIVYVFSGLEEPIGTVGEKVIYVFGEVGKPGMYRFSGVEPCTLLHLILKVGGLPEFADPRAIKIIKHDSSGKESETIVNAEKLVEEGNPSEDVQLESGDRVIVPARRLHIF